MFFAGWVLRECLHPWCTTIAMIYIVRLTELWRDSICLSLFWVRWWIENRYTFGQSECGVRCIVFLMYALEQWFFLFPVSPPYTYINERLGRTFKHNQLLCVYVCTFTSSTSLRRHQKHNPNPYFLVYSAVPFAISNKKKWIQNWFEWAITYSPRRNQ